MLSVLQSQHHSWLWETYCCRRWHITTDIDASDACNWSACCKHHISIDTHVHTQFLLHIHPICLMIASWEEASLIKVTYRFLIEPLGAPFPHQCPSLDSKHWVWCSSYPFAKSLTPEPVDSWSASPLGILLITCHTCCNSFPDIKLWCSYWLWCDLVGHPLFPAC